MRAEQCARATLPRGLAFHARLLCGLETRVETFARLATNPAELFGRSTFLAGIRCWSREIFVEAAIASLRLAPASVIEVGTAAEVLFGSLCSLSARKDKAGDSEHQRYEEIKFSTALAPHFSILA
jgi:hypothetical protein